MAHKCRHGLKWAACSGCEEIAAAVAAEREACAMAARDKCHDIAAGYPEQEAAIILHVNDEVVEAIRARRSHNTGDGNG